MLAYEIPKYIKRIILHDQVGFIPGMPGMVNVLHNSKEKKGKKSHDDLNRGRKSLDKIQH